MYNNQNQANQNTGPQFYPGHNGIAFPPSSTDTVPNSISAGSMQISDGNGQEDSNNQSNSWQSAGQNSKNAIYANPSVTEASSVSKDSEQNQNSSSEPTSGATTLPTCSSYLQDISMQGQGSLASVDTFGGSVDNSSLNSRPFSPLASIASASLEDPVMGTKSGLSTTTNSGLLTSHSSADQTLSQMNQMNSGSPMRTECMSSSFSSPLTITTSLSNGMSSNNSNSLMPLLASPGMLSPSNPLSLLSPSGLSSGALPKICLTVDQAPPAPPPPPYPPLPVDKVCPPTPSILVSQLL